MFVQGTFPSSGRATVAEACISTLQGAALGAMVAVDADAEQRLLAFVIRTARRELDNASTSN